MSSEPSKPKMKHNETEKTPPTPNDMPPQATDVAISETTPDPVVVEISPHSPRVSLKSEDSSEPPTNDSSTAREIQQLKAELRKVAAGKKKARKAKSATKTPKLKKAQKPNNTRDGPKIEKAHKKMKMRMWKLEESNSLKKAISEGSYEIVKTTLKGVKKFVTVEIST